MSQKDRREIQEMIEGQHWAHWRYGEEEWRKFTESDWARERRKAKLMPLRVLGIMLVVGLVGPRT